MGAGRGTNVTDLGDNYCHISAAAVHSIKCEEVSLDGDFLSSSCPFFQGPLSAEPYKLPHTYTYREINQSGAGPPGQGLSCPSSLYPLPHKSPTPPVSLAGLSFCYFPPCPPLLTDFSLSQKFIPPLVQILSANLFSDTGEWNRHNFLSLH